MKIKGLEKTIKQTIYDFKDRKNYLENTLDTLNDNIISLNRDITRKDGQIAKQAEQIDKAISLLKEQKNKLEEQEALLNKEKKDAQTQTDPYVDEHLTADIQRLKQEKTVLNKQIQELKEQVQSDKETHDQELAELRTKLDTLAKSFQEAQDIDQQVYDILGQQSQQTGLLLRSQEVIQKINNLTAERDNRPTQQQLTNLQNQLTSTQQQLQKELSWWDKWFEDNGRVGWTSTRGFFQYWQADERFSVGLYNRNYDLIDLTIKSSQGNWKSFSLREQKESVKKAIYQYYRNK